MKTDLTDADIGECMYCEVCKSIDDLPTVIEDTKDFVFGIDHDQRMILIFKRHYIDVNVEVLRKAVEVMHKKDATTSVNFIIRGAHIILLEQ